MRTCASLRSAMSVLFETSLGDIVIDLQVESCPKTSENFLKLCKLYYYNLNAFFNGAPYLFPSPFVLLTSIQFQKIFWLRRGTQLLLVPAVNLSGHILHLNKSRPRIHPFLDTLLPNLSLVSSIPIAAPFPWPSHLP